MSELPNGWETVAIGEISDIYQPTTIAKSKLVPDGKYLVYGANGVIGRYNEYNHENSELLITCRGATCGSVNISEPFSWINGNAMVVRPSGVEPKFLNIFFVVRQTTQILFQVLLNLKLLVKTLSH